MPIGPMGLGALTFFHMAWDSAYGLPSVLASQHMRLHGTTMDGATLCPQTNRAKTISVEQQGRIGPHIAVVTAVYSPDPTSRGGADSSGLNTNYPPH